MKKNMRFFKLCLILGTSLLNSGNVFAGASSVQISKAASAPLSSSAQESAITAESPYFWDLLGCAQSRYDCQYEASREGYFYYAAQRDLYTCNNFFYPYACYGGW